LLLVAALAAVVSVAGCGSSDSSGVTVQTGSLSKAEFVKKADAICEAARTALVAKFFNFLKTHQAAASGQNAQSKAALLGEAVDSAVTPNVEKEIDQISTLGAPGDYASEVASFLDVLQEQLEKLQEDPNQLAISATPFKQAGSAAGKAGMSGCAQSLS
jgi:hypothetical protein